MYFDKSITLANCQRNQNNKIFEVDKTSTEVIIINFQ